MYKQGDIVFINYPYSDFSGSKPRPALIISNANLKNIDELIFLPITGTIFNDGFGFNIERGMTESEIPKTSQIPLNKVQAMHKKLILRKVNQLKPQYLKQTIERFVKNIEVK